MFTYMATISGWFATMLVLQGFPLTILPFFCGLMLMFGYVHERIWHDSNFGIDPVDKVDPRRNLAKTLTYRGVSLTVMASIFGAVGHVPWAEVMIFQGSASVLYLGLETVWSKSEWGIDQTVDFKESPSETLLPDAAG